jgi:hypothetical protein
MRQWAVRCCFVLLALAAAAPASADLRYRAKLMTRNDVPPGRGQCDIRLMVDGQVDVTVRGDTIIVHTISGQEARDDGSECNFPIPDREPAGFNFQAVESRNEMRLVEPPARRNDFGAIVQIRDSSSGFGRYRFRLTWENGPIRELRRDESDRRDEHFNENNVLNFRGKGLGEVRVNGANARRLLDASVDIDRAGRIIVSFRTDSPRPILFTGSVMAREEGRLKADMTSEDRRLHGPMYLMIDARQVIGSITLEATDGQERLHLTWNRK